MGVVGPAYVAWDAINTEKSVELKTLIDEYSDVFAVNLMEVGCTNFLQHHVDACGHAPVKAATTNNPIFPESSNR